MGDVATEEAADATPAWHMPAYDNPFQPNPEVKTGTLVPKAEAEAARQEPGEQDDLGARSLHFIRAYLGHWCAWPSEEDLDKVTLWCGHAMARDEEGQLVWWATPRLILHARKRGTGKSTAGDLICLLDGGRRLTRITPTALTDHIRQKRIVVLDEAHLLFGTGAKSVQLQSDLNGGYTRLGAAAVAGKELSTFGPVVACAKTQMLDTDSDSLNDLASRALLVEMTAARHPVPEIDDDTMSFGAKAGSLLREWATVNASRLKATAKDIGREWQASGIRLSEGQARQAQIRRPLEAVARVAGGDWPDRYEAAFGHHAKPKSLTVMDELNGEMADW